MNSPLIILEKYTDLPIEALDIIQSYLVNNIAYAAIASYFSHLYMKKEKYEEFIWNNYVYSQCYCNNCPDNGVRKIFKKRDCDPCFIFENTFTYMPNDFNECILNNNQFRKIYYGEKKTDEYQEYEYEY